MNTEIVIPIADDLWTIIVQYFTFEDVKYLLKKDIEKVLLGRYFKYKYKTNKELEIRKTRYVYNFIINMICRYWDDNEMHSVNHKELRYLKNMKRINLCFDAHGNFSNDQLNQYKNLVSLNLTDNHLITDKGLQKMVHLKELYLGKYDCLITDKGIKALINLEKLRVSRSITDKGIQYLFSLKELDLRYSNKITSNSIRNLINLEIIYLPKHKNMIDPMVLLKLPKLQWIINENGDRISKDTFEVATMFIH